jgi:hypothetical protein
MTKTILIIFGSIFVNTICFADMTDSQLSEMNSHLQAIERNQQNQQQDQLTNQLIMHGLQQREQQQQRKLQEQQYQQQHPQMLPSIQNGRLVYTPAQ